MTVIRGVSDSAVEKGREVNTDQDVLVIMDIIVDDDLKSEANAREFINRVQRYRKKLGLQATDEVQVEVEITKDTIGLADCLKKHCETIEKTLRRPVKAFGEEKEGKSLGEEDQEISDATFKLRLLQL